MTGAEASAVPVASPLISGRLVIASNNVGKLREFRALFGPLGIDAVAQGELGVDEVEEPHPTFLENALVKARHASRMTGLPALADDSGLCVDALLGRPGVHSARYAGLPRSDLRNNAHLITALTGVSRREAHYYCVLVLIRGHEDPEPMVAEGRWSGAIIDEARGTGGFGYDPHFFLPEFGCTAAELAADQKNRVSHRAQALRELVARLGGV